jgi:hypothetical protein
LFSRYSPVTDIGTPISRGRQRGPVS